MEKYAEIIKAMGECAGPDCGLTCPYKDKSVGAKSCRAVLLEDAIAALVGEMAESDKLNADVDDLEAATNTLRAERDGMRIELEAYQNKCQALTKECLSLTKECEALTDARDDLVLELGQMERKTDRPSVSSDDLAKQIG